MKIQVLVATMHQIDSSLIKRMNIQTNVIVGNQCDRCSDEVFSFNDFRAVYYNRKDRGVGYNRNVALSHSEDNCILTFADDDMQFVDNYAQIISKAFKELPDADAIIFNIETIGRDMGRRKSTKIKRVRFYNALNYGAARISVKSNSVKRENIFFHTCFGGGTRYSSGEDSLFIVDMLKHKFKVYVYPVCVAQVDQNTSTWFDGYTEKYFHDKGALFAAISYRWAKVLSLQDLLRHKKMYRVSQLSFAEQYRMMKRGRQAFNTLDILSVDDCAEG